MSESNIRLVALHDGILEEYLALKVSADQDTFVEPPEESLEDQQKRAWDIDWTIECIYAGDHMIGYAMHGMNRERDAWLDRFMIDRQYQGHGYGTAALTQLLQKMKTCYPDPKSIVLSVEKHNKAAIKIYERFGFRMTDQMDGIYPVMVLVNGQSNACM